MNKLLPATESLIKRMKELDIITNFYSKNYAESFEEAQFSFPEKHDLIWEIITSSDRCYMEDAESGRYPPDYESLIKSILAKLFPSLTNYAVQLEYEEEPKLKDIKLSLRVSDETHMKTLEDHGDYYDCRSVLNLLNQAIKLNKDQAIYDIETNDQGFCFMLLNLGQIKTLFQLYNFDWQDDYINNLCLNDWSSSTFIEPGFKNNKTDFTPKQLTGMLRNSIELTDNQLMELCKRYEHRMLDGMPEFYEEVLTSSFEGSAIIAKSILVERHGYGGREIHSLIMKSLFDPKKINAISNFIFQIYNWPISILPSLARILGLFDTMESANFEKRQPYFEWSILLVGYNDKKLYGQLLSILQTSNNDIVKRISIETMGLSTFVLNYLFPKKTRDKTSKLFIELINAKDNKMSAAVMVPYLRLLSTTISTKKLFSIFEEIRSNIDVLSMIECLKLINRSVFLNGYDPTVEKTYLSIWEQNSIYPQYLIPGLLQSRNPEIQKKLADASNSSDSSIKGAFEYDLKKAQAEEEEIKRSIQVFKKMIHAKHE